MINKIDEIKVRNMIKAFEVEEESNVKICLIYRHGQRIGSYLQEPYEMEDKQLLFSMTKSFTSLAVGIAWDKGLLDLQDKVIISLKIWCFRATVFDDS